ncbi:MAG: seg [Microgenomates group bacterium GW2011_GWC1_38_14]|nr:MAG: Adhesion or S-layer protein [Candidatus Levybacteria bacterium GW2011_GWA2_36_13]KKQ58002.1 MAG: seg [Microgenomates group bacterium GW2011_GWC1_38_14]
MGQKKAVRRHTVWSLFNNWRVFNSFLFGRINSLHLQILRTLKVKNSLSGFTIVELLVILGILGILFAAFLAVFNPLGQIAKATDAQKKRDLEQIRIALDVYYNDKNCYPIPAGIPFGGQWAEGSTIYMKKVPQNPYFPYIYDNNGINLSSCPQWGVLFAHLESTQSATVLCPLDNQPQKCIPDNAKQKGYNYCVVTGIPDCSYLATSTAFDNIVLPTPTPTPTSGPPPQGPTPTATPTPLPPGSPTPTPTPTANPTPSPTPPPTIQYGDCFCSQGGQPGGPLYDIRSGNCNLVNPGPYNYCDSSCILHCR